MIPRQSEKVLKEFSRGYPVVAVTGPRQSGKTTLVRHVFKDKPYVSLETPDTRELAHRDPRGFLERYKDGAVFDEVQRTPQLFSYLQEQVDSSRRTGRYVLTGSQQFGMLSGISQSLSGRVAMVHLLPFSCHEMCGVDENFLDASIDQILYTGLYPPVHDRNLNPHVWYANYVQTYIERDVRQMTNIRDLSTFQRFVRLCAGRVGQLLNLSGLASDCGITHNTAKSWISILEASYIIFLLQPHHRNFNKRIIKTPKLYFFDTGLAAWLLGIQSCDQLNTHSLRGALFESFVISELLKGMYHRGLRPLFYFWRDRSGNEVDLIWEHGEKLQPIEIKSGLTLNQDYFGGLKKWADIAGATSTEPTLVYGGVESLTHSGIKVISWKKAVCGKDMGQGAGV